MHSHDKVYKTILADIQADILAGELKPGDRLPTERALAEQHQVSRASVREALRILDIFGLIESRQGGGNYVCHNVGQALLEPVSMMFKLQGGGVAGIIELRQILEGQAVRLAAGRITPEQRNRLQQLLESLQTEKKREKRGELDQEIHALLVAAAGNPLLSELYGCIAGLLREFIAEAGQLLRQDQEREKLLLRQHDAIGRAVLEGDGEKAGDLIAEHLKFVFENLA